MKQRLLVLNGQRLIQTEQGGQWSTERVEKAGAVKPGIYDIHLATQADKSTRHNGLIIYVDKDNVYQQVGKSFIKHARTDFDNVPDVGANFSVTYENDKARISPSSIKRGRGIS